MKNTAFKFDADDSEVVSDPNKCAKEQFSSHKKNLPKFCPTLDAITAMLFTCDAEIIGSHEKLTTPGAGRRECEWNLEGGKDSTKTISEVCLHT